MKKSNIPLLTLNALLVFGAVAIINNAHAGDDIFGIERSKQAVREMVNPKINLAPTYHNNTPGTQRNFPGKNEGAFKGLEQGSSPSPSPIPYVRHVDPKEVRDFIDLVNKIGKPKQSTESGSNASRAPGRKSGLYGF